VIRNLLREFLEHLMKNQNLVLMAKCVFWRQVYNCDVCSSSYQRQFSLKRHYLRTHVNARLLTERDAANCGIALGADTPSNATDLYRCHLCAAVFFARRDKLVAHLALHPIDAQGVLAPFPTSSASGGAVCAAPVGPPSQVFSCDACATTFTSRVNLLKHEALHQVGAL
jgi:Zinc-finger of C2H2 type